MNKLLLLLFGSMFLSLSLLAQKTIKGTVVDESGRGVYGVSILIQGAKKGVQSDKDGNFSITVPATGNTNLTFSSVGFAKQTVVAADNLSVHLIREVNTQDEVVVVGYQSVRRRDLTASVSSVSARDLKDNPSNNAASALAGKLAGVQVQTSEGAPGADVDIYIRGRNSITQSGSPLYVVDGIQIDNALSVLSPQDIQSIDVLKDAAATAIYGARGSNGVVLITTKGGRNTGGKTTVSYNAFVGISHLTKEIPFMDPYNFVLYSYERAKYTENAQDTGAASQYIRNMSNYDTIKNYQNYPQTQDWQDAILGGNALQSTHNISVSGGTAATQYNVSATLNQQAGLISNSDFNRKLLNFRLDHKVNDKLKIGFNTRFNRQKVTGAGTSDAGGAGSNRLRQYTRYRPLILPGQTEDYYDPYLDVTLNPGNSLSLKNPIQLMKNEYRLRTITNYNYNGYINYNLTKKISFRSTFGYDVNKTESKSLDDTLTNISVATNKQPLINLNNVDITTINNSNVFTYSNPSLFRSRHSLDVLLGQEIYQTNVKTTAMQLNWFPVGTTPDQAFDNYGLATPPAGLSQPKQSSAEVNTHQLSFFTRLNYAYNKKYLLTLNFRADGSSIFGPDYSSPIPPTDPTNRKWGYFPSASFAWKFSDENFMKKLSFITQGKLRLSYGQAGNNRITPYGYTTGYAPPSNAGYGLSDALAYTLALPSNLGNPVLSWETLDSKNIGLDLAFFNNRLTFTADAYSNVTKDLLVQNKIPTTSGYTTQFQNVGSVRNNGLELQLSAAVIQKKDFQWNANFNIAWNANKILSLGQQTKFTANSNWFNGTNDDYIVQVGHPLGEMYGLKNDGYYTLNDFDVTPYVDATNNAKYPTLLYQYTLKAGIPSTTATFSDAPSPGSIKFKDINGDGKISIDSDRVVTGNALPKFTGGFNQQFQWKGFDASIAINFSYGNDIFNANKLEFSNQYGQDQNMLATFDGRWKTIDQNGNLIQKELPKTGGGFIIVGQSPAQLAAANPNPTIWQPLISTTGYLPMSYAIEDGSYIRINNITLGYTLPQSLIKRVKISSLRFYATVNNVATITGYSGYDPDVNARRGSALTPGVDYAAYPRGRTFIAGVNLNF